MRSAKFDLFQKEDDVQRWRGDAGLGQQAVNLSAVMGLVVEQRHQDMIDAGGLFAVADDAAIDRLGRQGPVVQAVDQIDQIPVLLA